MIKLADSSSLIKTLEMREKLWKNIGHSLELYMGCHGNHTISHHPNGLIFEKKYFLHVSVPNDYFSITNCHGVKG